MLRDLRYATRMLRKSPLFTAAVVGTIALGIGANTAIFSVVNAVMLRPLPFKEPDRLVWIAERNDKLQLPRFAASVLNYLSWKEQSGVFEPIGAFGFGTYSLTGSGGEPEQITGGTLTPSLFGLLGLQPVAGRSFVDGDDCPGSPRVAMISEGAVASPLRRRPRHRRPERLGERRRLHDRRRRAHVVDAALRRRHVAAADDRSGPRDPAESRRARRRPDPAGVTLAQAQSEMDGVAARVSQQYPEMKEWAVRLVGFYDSIVNPQLRTALMVLLSAVGCVLLIASANVANLLLARAASRQREMAVAHRARARAGDGC